MVPTLVFHELGLVALVWVFLMLYWLWPNDSAARRQPNALSTAEDEYPLHSPQGSRTYLRLRGCAGVRQRILRVCRATASPIMPSQNVSMHVPSRYSNTLWETTHDTSVT
jgi:hypothetical protein